MKTCLLALFILFSPYSLSSAGPEIPLPLTSYQQAYHKAEAQLHTEKDNIDPLYAPAKEYILHSITYIKRNPQQWVWAIVFIHPRANDHSVTYHVDQKGAVTLKSVSE